MASSQNLLCVYADCGYGKHWRQESDQQCEWYVYAADNSECVDVQICKQVYVSFYLFFINIGEETEDFYGGNMKIYSKGIQEG